MIYSHFDFDPFQHDHYGSGNHVSSVAAAATRAAAALGSELLSATDGTSSSDDMLRCIDSAVASIAISSTSKKEWTKSVSSALESAAVAAIACTASDDIEVACAVMQQAVESSSVEKDAGLCVRPFLMEGAMDDKTKKPVATTTASIKASTTSESSATLGLPFTLTRVTSSPSVYSSSFDAKTQKTYHLGSNSFDAYKASSVKTEEGPRQHRVVELPNNLKNVHPKPDGTHDVKTSASTECGEVTSEEGYEVSITTYQQLKSYTVNENATRIQSFWRSYKPRENYKVAIRSVLSLQSLIRGRLTVWKYHQLKCRAVYENATRIQSCWRSTKARTDYVYVILGATSLQSLIRCRLQIRKYQQLRCRAVENATRIQSCWRTHARKLQLVQSRRSCAAVTIQSAFRSHLHYPKFIATLASIITIQSCIHGRLTVRKYQLVQSRRESATVIIQSVFRSHLHYSKYIATVVSTITIQSCFRMWAASREKRKLVCSAIKLQSVFRQRLTIPRVNELKYIATVVSAITIQSCFRMWVALREKRKFVSSAIKLQSVFRQHLTILRVNELRFITKVASPITISVFRRHFITLRINALREFRVMYEKEMIKKFENTACIAIQKWWRHVRLQRKRAEERHLRYMRDTKAALLIQTNFRRHKAMVDFLFTVTDVVLCQAAVRQFLALKHTMQLREMKSATKIQATWRRYLASKRIILENKAVAAIQTCFRGSQNFLSYVVKNCSAIEIQACTRGHFAKYLLKRLKQEKQEKMEQERMILRNVAATAIQSSFRGYRDFVRFLMKIFIIIQIQTRVREYQARCRHLPRLKYGKQRNFSIIQIQTRVRGYQIRCHLQRLKQENQEEKRIVLQNAAATAIQTCFRGYRDFVTFVILQYFVNKTQACIRGNQARCRLKRSKQEDVDKQIKENKQFSDVVSRVPIAQIKTNRPRAADDVSLSSVSVSSSRRDLLLSTLSISPIQKKHTPRRMELQEQRKKKEVAFVLDRSSEIEITPLEQDKLTPECKGNREGIPSSISSVCSFSGYRETPATPSPHKEPTSDSHPPSGFKSAYHNSGRSRRAASGVVELTPLEVHPSSVRRRKDTGAEQTPSPTSVQALLSDVPIIEPQNGAFFTQIF